MKKLIWIFASLAWFGWAGSVFGAEAKPADPGCVENAQCVHCGCQTACKKVCRLVCETKKVEITCWEVQCEEFCPVLPKIFGKRCGCGDPGCGPDKVAGGGCDVGCGKELAVPQCGKSRVKKTLVKKTMTKEVPVYRCVVEHVCGQCCGPHAGEAPPVSPGPPAQKAAPAPPPPPKAALRSTIQPISLIPEAPEPATESAPEPLPRLVLDG